MADKTLNDNIDDIPAFLLRSTKDVTPKFVGKLSDDLKKAANSSVQTREPLQAVIALPGPAKAPDPLPDRPKSYSWDSIRPEGFTEEVYRTTQWDNMLNRRMTTVQYRRWDAQAQLWFEYERMLRPGETGREQIPPGVFERPTHEDYTGVDKWSVVRGIYFEGLEAFDGEKFLKLGFSDLIDLCPYDKGSVHSSEWWEGWFSAAKAFWIGFNKELEQNKVTDEAERIYVC